MAETITIEGQPYLKRNPLGVLGLSLITFGIYFFYWYYKVNDELRRLEHDESISPTRSLMADALRLDHHRAALHRDLNTANHIQAAERRAGVLQQIEPVLVLVIMLIISIANGVYIQEHQNRIWDRAGGAVPPPPQPVLPPTPTAPTG